MEVFTNHSAHLLARMQGRTVDGGEMRRAYDNGGDPIAFAGSWLIKLASPLGTRA